MFENTLLLKYSIVHCDDKSLQRKHLTFCVSSFPQINLNASVKHFIAVNLQMTSREQKIDETLIQRIIPLFPNADKIVKLQNFTISI